MIAMHNVPTETKSCCLAIAADRLECAMVLLRSCVRRLRSGMASLVQSMLSAEDAGRVTRRLYYSTDIGAGELRRGCWLANRLR